MPGNSPTPVGVTGRVTPNFRRTLRAVKEKNIVVPTLRAMTHDFKIPPFSIQVTGPNKRGYDGWFHPSSQATMTTRQLYYYLTAPELFESEELDISSMFAITQGHFWHEFIQAMLLANGLLLRAEVPLADHVHHRRGHMDGELNNGEGLEIKTINPYTMAKLKDADDIKEQKPEYYAQAQDYLDMSKKKRMRFVFLGLTYPFDMVEIVVEADPDFQAAQREKYTDALEAAAEGVPPEACCAFGSPESKSCPARFACPVGRKK